MFIGIIIAALLSIIAGPRTVRPMKAVFTPSYNYQDMTPNDQRKLGIEPMEKVELIEEPK